MSKPSEPTRFGFQGAMPRPSEKENHNTVSDLAIDCFHLDFDGEEFKPIFTTIKIKPYDELRAVRSLPVYPLSFADMQSSEDGKQGLRKWSP